ncbi:glycosyltransferase [Limnoglobus roseus]|uniref:GT2 family glycosyltransferase n=1 Tax=Limnoglobus roseus TaxID=2598579 RepID=A0A5C1A8H0_9BACT|nr:glycosyltransferase [Limnoglobus roseus]QEL15040.1 GT2 family glycosyltransferase [Limnoglobus roseus]
MISLVLPAYNPGAAVEQTWHALRDFLRSRPEPWEAVIVLDGCTDGTVERLQKLQSAADHRLRVISYSPNRGKGYAVRTGLQAARGDIRLFTDIDLAYGFDDVVRVADEVASGAPVAVASRTHPESILQLPAKLLGYAYRRKLQSVLFGRVARTLLPLRQTDTQAGLKGMTAEVAEHVLPLLTCDGFGFDCELLTACVRADIPITEVPVRVRYDDEVSTTGSRTGFKMLRELWTIRRAWKRKNVAAFVPPVREPAPVRKAA